MNSMWFVNKWFLLIALSPVVTSASPHRSENGTFEMTGVTLSSSGSAVVENSVLILGEPLTGHSSNAFYSLDVGFAAVLAASSTPLGDCDGDGDVDTDDLIEFELCLLGPGGGLDVDCDCLDLDGSGSVDLYDFARFQNAYTGP